MSGMASNLNNQNKARQNCMYISWDVLCMEWPQNCVYFVGYPVCGVASVLYDQNKTKHNKTVWIFYRIYFLSKMASNWNNQNKTTHSNNVCIFHGIHSVWSGKCVVWPKTKQSTAKLCVYFVGYTSCVEQPVSCTPDGWSGVQRAHTSLIHRLYFTVVWRWPLW